MKIPYPRQIVDSGPESEKHCIDGYGAYLDVVFPGEHIRNIHNNKDTLTAEGINADSEYFIPLLRRHSRCFARNIETVTAVMDVFAEAYNGFDLTKSKYRQANSTRYSPFELADFLFAR